MDFNELVKTNKENVKNIIRLITRQDNEDLEQEVYLKVWKNADKYEEQGSLKSWINTIAKNVSKDYLKSAMFRNANNTTSDEIVLGTIKDTKQSPEAKSVANERQLRIINAIENLKPKFKEVIMLCEIHGNTYEEASKILKCPIGTIKSRIYNAKKELAIQLEDLL